MAREQKNIDLIELSRRSGISRPTIRNIENGRSAWNVDTEIILMEVLGIKNLEGSIELNADGDKITSLRITGVNLRNMCAPK